MAREWTRVSKRISSWPPKRADPIEKLDDIADDHLAVLHRTIRADPGAFGLYEAACAAGERLTTTATAVTRSPVHSERDFAVRFTAAVGGEGGTIADAAVRRAAATSATTLLRRHPEVTEDGRGLAGDLFCLLYKLFFADVVGAFLHAVVAEKIKCTVPILPLVDPEDHFADRVAGKVLDLLPDPCEEAARVKSAERATDAAATVEDPSTALPEIAGRLVPRTVGRALGLVAVDDNEPGGAVASLPFEGDTAA